MHVSITRCQACGTSYEFQASGPAPEDTNHAEYCPKCFTKVRAVLDTIPRRFVGKFRNVEELPRLVELGATVDAALQWEACERKAAEERQQAVRASRCGKCTLEVLLGSTRQIYPSGFDRETVAVKNVRAVRTSSAHILYRFKFVLSTWSDKKRAGTLQVEMEWDNESSAWTGNSW